ncbi:MAG: hypothetical protein JWL60_249 [Gemmatimonadetes bacterium]|jgi:hypothetical protein|nr:hypothetical protein [Gemmatimonadota bacterium]
MAVATLLTLAAPHSAPAQDRPAAWGFVNARYDTRTSSFLYSGYGHGPLFAFAGVLANPRSGYTEVLGGAGATFDAGSGSSHMVALAAARATEAWYAQLYYLPTVRAGILTARATTQLYIPLEGAGVRQLAITPLSVTMPVARRLEAGLATEVAAAQGAATYLGIGPELRLAIPRATLGTDLFLEVTEGRGLRWRTFFSTAF